MARLVSFALFSLALVAAEAHANQPKVGIGVGVRTTDDGVLVNQVLRGSGAEAAGVEQGDIITSVNGKEISRVSETTELIGKPCTFAKSVKVKRGSKTITFDRILRVPRRKPGDCLGYYEFRTETQKRKRKDFNTAGKELFDAWKKKSDGAKRVSAVNDDFSRDKLKANVAANKQVKSFVHKIGNTLGVNVRIIQTHTDEVFEHLAKSMPEGEGTWELEFIEMRFADKVGGGKGGEVHWDPGAMAVLTTLSGRPTLINRAGCLGDPTEMTKKDLRSVPRNTTVVIGGDRRFANWRRIPDEDVPEAIKATRAACSVGGDTSEAKKQKENGRRKKENVQGAIHAEPDDKRKRVTLVLNLRFKPAKK